MAFRVFLSHYPAHHPKMEFSTWAISDYAAWWGAIIASLALAWNIFNQLRSGPRIHVRATPNMRFFPETPLTKGKTYIVVTAVNRGNAPTTITCFGGYHSSVLWDFRKKKRQYFVIPPIESMGSNVPCLLAPGEEWKNFIEQSPLQKDFGKGCFYIGVGHNQSNRLIYAKVRLNP